MANPETTEEPETRTTVEARQGDWRRMNLRVLLISCALAVVVLTALYLFVFSIPE